MTSVTQVDLDLVVYVLLQLLYINGEKFAYTDSQYLEARY